MANRRNFELDRNLSNLLATQVSNYFTSPGLYKRPGKFFRSAGKTKDPT